MQSLALILTPLPSDTDLAWAREECRDELATVAFPAYVLDCAHRLVAWNLRRLRVARGQSQEDLALEAEVDRSYMSRLERGVVNPTIGVLEQIADALDAHISDFFIEPAKGEPRPKPLRGGRRPERITGRRPPFRG